MGFNLSKLGEPDIHVCGLRIWVYGRQYPDDQDYWDGNWLTVTIAYSTQTSIACVGTGPWIHTSELLHWKEELQAIYGPAKGIARLDCMEPMLKAKVSLDDKTFDVVVKPQCIGEEHHYVEDIDQSHLPALIRQIEKVLETYPIRSSPEAG